MSEDELKKAVAESMKDADEVWRSRPNKGQVNDTVIGGGDSDDPPPKTGKGKKGRS